MKLATRTALIYASLTATILLLFTAVVLIVSEQNREHEFFDRLGYKITWRAEFFFDVDVEPALFKELHAQNKKILNEADVSIYNQNGQLLFSDLKPALGSPELLERLKSKGKKVLWSEGEYQYMGTTYLSKGQEYFIVGRAHDDTGIAHTKRIKKSIIITLIISILVTAIVGFLFSYYTLKPLKDIIIQIQDISEHRLNHRLVVPKAKDELYELAETFNTTFNRLEKSFNSHKNFVTIISHEFRTPLSSMIAELQLANELNTTVNEYRQSIENALGDAQRASELSAAILDFARASYDVSQISWEKVRIDEVLMDAKLNLQQKQPDYNIRINYKQLGDEEVEDPEVFELEGNPYLLQVAFLNLMENACKYSADKQCEVSFSYTNTHMSITFTDHGIGIPIQDREKIFDLFYRGENQTYKKGNGIGLSIVKQIVKLHKGSIELKSEVNAGTQFKISF